jgi:hypothetical protein
MPIHDTFIRRYVCDFPGCKEESTSDPRDGSESHVTVTVDAGEADTVHRAVLCRLRHASPLHDELRRFGFRKERR